MNNKGFTLIELLAVIAILSMLSILTVVNINNSLNREDANDINRQQELAISAGKIYFSLHDNITCVNISTLKNTTSTGDSYFPNNFEITITGSVRYNNGVVTYNEGTC